MEDTKHRANALPSAASGQREREREGTTAAAVAMLDGEGANKCCKRGGEEEGVVLLDDICGLPSFVCALAASVV